MALIKAIETPYGVQATYWKIVTVTEQFTKSSLIVQMAGYLDAESRTAEKEPIMSGQYSIDDDVYTADATREDIYQLLKQTDQFVDAIDG